MRRLHGEPDRPEEDRRALGARLVDELKAQEAAPRALAQEECDVAAQIAGIDPEPARVVEADMAGGAATARRVRTR